MIQRDVSFDSEGSRLDGSFYFPEHAAAERTKPCILACSGFTGLKNIHPERFARAFTARRYTCFGFDYRGFGKSEGTPGRILLEEQVEDIVSACNFIRHDTITANMPLVVLGWGMAGGLILEAAKSVSVDALVCLNGFYNGRRVQQALRGEEGYKQFVEWVEKEQENVAQTREISRVDPFAIYPLDPVTSGYVDEELYKTPGYGGQVETVLADSLLQFDPECSLESFAEVPLFIAHGRENGTHPPTEAESLYAKYPGPKELYWLDNVGHTEWMYDDHPRFRELVVKILGWVERLHR